MNELIEKLKNKNYVRAFGLMKPEEQECYQKVGKINCVYFSGFHQDWAIPASDEEFSYGTTFAIKPSYQPEPETRDFEITPNADTWLGSQTPTGNWVRLYKIPSMPNFAGFWFGKAYLHEEDVAPNLRLKNPVIARFRV